MYVLACTSSWVVLVFASNHRNEYCCLRQTDGGKRLRATDPSRSARSCPESRLGIRRCRCANWSTNHKSVIPLIPLVFRRRHAYAICDHPQGSQAYERMDLERFKSLQHLSLRSRTLNNSSVALFRSMLVLLVSSNSNNAPQLEWMPLPRLSGSASKQRR